MLRLLQSIQRVSLAVRTQVPIRGISCVAHVPFASVSRQHVYGAVLGRSSFRPSLVHARAFSSENRDDANDANDANSSDPGARPPEDGNPVPDVEAVEVRQELVDPADVIPSHLTVFPNYNRPLFPGLVASHLILDDALWEDIVKEYRTGTKMLGVFYAKDHAREKKAESITSVDDIYHIGVAARIIRLIPGVQGRSAHMMYLIGRKRVNVTEVLQSKPRLVVKVSPLTDKPFAANDMNIKASVMEIYRIIKDIVKLNPFYKEQLQTLVEMTDVSKPAELADMAAALTTGDGNALQEVVEATDIPHRLDLALRLLKKELDLTQLQQKIHHRLEEQVSAKQKQYFLQEQLKTIKRELGIEKDEKEELLNKLKARIEKLTIPDDSMKVIQDEMNKLSLLEPSSSEFNVSRNYLDWLTALPWGIYSKENFEIPRAVRVLNHDHYGLEDVKDRILEFIAVGNLKKSVQGKIILFVGPPGVGKTSIGKSIASALNRKFFRFSVGGMSDASEIKGHRRTYVGAMPGKLIQCLKKVQVANPVIMIDEVDKMGVSHQGDPASTLLEVLDPEQNAAFLDHYLDTPFDLSKVLFILTANSTDTISKPLLDRMEVIRLSGYVLEEKMAIASKYLIPQVQSETGLTTTDVKVTEEAIRTLIKGYSREAGVRGLRQHIERLHRKAALQLVQRKAKKPVIVTPANLNDFVGKPMFTKDRIYTATPPGVVMGLAWTAMGGSTLFIEAINAAAPKNKTPGWEVSGHLGDVMKESGRIALSYAKTYFRHLQPKSSFFETSQIHLHVPEGATPKDGPSAGITMVTALLSLATGKPVISNVAMTGEVTLTGKVLPIGGVKEKTIAARRAGVKHLILPEDNRRDFDELADNLKQDLIVHYASKYDDVYAVAFGDAAKKAELKASQEKKQRKAKPTKERARMSK